MPQGKSSWFHRTAVAFCILAVAVFLVMWATFLIRQFDVIEARVEFHKAIERGHTERVLALLDRIDPDGNGTATDYSGEEGLGARSGMSWLLERWRDCGHTEGTTKLYERRARLEPDFPREELVTHLEWMGLQPTHGPREGLFAFALNLDWSGKDAQLSQLFGLAESDGQLALLAWEAREKQKLLIPLPKAVIDRVLRETDFSDPEELDRFLRGMGMLEPVETFVVRESNHDEGFKSGISWIERAFAVIANERNSQSKKARSILESSDLAKATPETPGLFLLQRLLEDSEPSPVAEYREFSPEEIELALPVFERLSPQGKAGVSKLLDRNILDYGNHDALRTWVGQHLKPEWEKERARLDKISLDESNPIPGNQLIKPWLDSAGKYGFAEESTATVSHLHRLTIGRCAATRPFCMSSSFDLHPFFHATGSRRTRKGSGPLPGRFALVLAFGRDPSIPPCETFPLFETMCLYHSGNASQICPWTRLSTDEFHDAVTRLGEPFADDPLRFLIVPFFEQPVENLCQSLKNPAEIAKFQKLAASNNSRGGWLAKDLAELIPRWWCTSIHSHATLLANGGQSYSYDRANAYLEDKSTPVAARMSYAMGAIDWGVFSKNHNVEIGAPLPFFPDCDALALEFANQFKEEKWRIESISALFWKWFILRWLNEPSAADSSEAARNRKAARAAIRSRLDPHVRKMFASAPPRPAAAGRTVLDDMSPFLESYAALLRIDGDKEALANLWKEAERTMAHPKEIFSYSGIGADPPQLLGGASADAIVRRYRGKGWKAVREYLAGMDDATAYSALAEATSQLTFREWVDFCGKALDLRNDRAGSGTSGWQRFCAFPPSPFLKTARNLKTEERARFFAFEFAGVELPEEHSGFFSLALPVVIRNCVYRGESGSDYLRYLAENEIAPVSPLILREFDIACNTAASVIEGRHVDALRDDDIPLAQRWIGSAFFQISRADRSIYYRRIADWPMEIKLLSEAGIDVLLEAVDRDLPIWHVINRGLGGLANEPWKGDLTIGNFLSLHHLDKTSQERRAAALTEHSRIVHLLRDHPSPHWLLNSLYFLALEMNDRILAADLYTHAETTLSFEEKLHWLSEGEFHAPMAQLFSRQWRRIGELSLSFSSFAHGDELETILSALPEDPDLRRLVRATLQHSSMSTGLVNRYSQRLIESNSEVVDLFLREKFKSSEMEALCLARLPVRMEQSPQLGAWLENRLKDRDWKQMLAQDPPLIRLEWPYWARKLEALAGTGDFETLGKMLPAPSWFANQPATFPYDPDVKTDTIEEMVWMGFARPLAHHLRFGTPENRLDAGAIAARLLSSPPSSKRQNEVRRAGTTISHRATSFHAEAAQELWLHAIAATLSATLEEPPEVARARCQTFKLPMIRSVIHAPIVRGATHQTFFRLLAEFGETMTQKERTSFFLRGLDTEPFGRTPLTRNLPCYSLSRIQLPSQISLDNMVELARRRHESGGDSAYLAADLGLVLDLAKNPQEAVPVLEKALAALSPTRPEDLEILELIRPVHSRITSAARTKHPPVGQ